MNLSTPSPYTLDMLPFFRMPARAIQECILNPWMRQQSGSQCMVGPCLKSQDGDTRIIAGACVNVGV